MRNANCLVIVFGVIIDFILPKRHKIVLSVQLLFYDPSEYNNKMLKKLCCETQIHIELSASHYYIMRTHIVE